jgi:penicillin-binding protein 1C
VAGLVGRLNAAPILFDAFARLGQPLSPLKGAPKGALLVSTAKLPPPLKRFASRASAGESMTPKVQIVFPPNGASLELSGAEGVLDPIAIKIAGGIPPLNVLANGLPLPAKKSARTLFFAPDGPGFVRLTVTDASGAADSVVVRLQ